MAIQTHRRFDLNQQLKGIRKLDFTEYLVQWIDTETTLWNDGSLFVPNQLHLYYSLRKQRWVAGEEPFDKTLVATIDYYQLSQNKAKGLLKPIKAFIQSYSLENYPTVRDQEKRGAHLTKKILSDMVTKYSLIRLNELIIDSSRGHFKEQLHHYATTVLSGQPPAFPYFEIEDFDPRAVLASYFAPSFAAYISDEHWKKFQRYMLRSLKKDPAILSVVKDAADKDERSAQKLITQLCRGTQAHNVLMSRDEFEAIAKEQLGDCLWRKLTDNVAFQYETKC